MLNYGTIKSTSSLYYTLFLLLFFLSYNLIKTYSLCFLHIFQNMLYNFLMIAQIKEANKFQKAKVQHKGVRFCLFFSQPGVAYKKVRSSIEVLIGFVNSRSSHRRQWPITIEQQFDRVSLSLFFNKVAEHLRTTASVIPSFQYTLFISLSIFYFSLEYLWSHGLSA